MEVDWSIQSIPRAHVKLYTAHAIALNLAAESLNYFYADYPKPTEKFAQNKPASNFKIPDIYLMSRFVIFITYSTPTLMINFATLAMP